MQLLLPMLKHQVIHQMMLHSLQHLLVMEDILDKIQAKQFHQEILGQLQILMLLQQQPIRRLAKNKKVPLIAVVGRPIFECGPERGPFLW